MLGAIYNGLTGLISFSKALDVISNNVANLNTPGFKSSQIQFKDLFYQYRLEGQNDQNGTALQLGSGVDTTSTMLRFTSGELRDTGNDTDVAIDGNGFFILRKDGKVFYTRAGQFEFDADGFLVAHANGARVASSSGGELQDININNLRTNPAKATSEITFSGMLSTGDTQHEITGVTIYDAAGTAHSVKISFASSAPRIWTVEVRDAVDNSLLGPSPGPGEIHFRPDGSPDTGYNTVSFDYAPNGLAATTVVLNFGDPGSLAGATSGSGDSNSSLKVASQNGYGIGSLTSVSFDADGYLVANYSNAQTVKQNRLALASFDYLQGLEETGGNLFVNSRNLQVRLGVPGEGVMGKVKGKSIELSNVDLTQQFTDMIIVQRGYQGSSQIVSVTNEMIQQLFDIRGKR